jgi:hypothetical protein
MELANCKIIDQPQPKFLSAKENKMQIPSPASNNPAPISPPLANGNVPFDPAVHSHWQGSQHPPPNRANSQPSIHAAIQNNYPTRGYSMQNNSSYNIVD